MKFHAIFAQKHGEDNPHLYASAFGEGHWQEVEHKYEKLISSPDTGEEFSEIVVFKDGEKFGEHKFAKRATHLQVEAQKVHQEFKAAERTLELAQKRHDDAKAALENLTDEHRQFLGL